MILGECGIFAAMFAAGAVTGVISAILNVLGRTGKAARYVTDVLMALSAGVVYFIALQLFAYGVFRIYSLAAYLIGTLCSLRLLRRFSPYIRSLARKVMSPLLKGYYRAENRILRICRPLIEKEERKRIFRRQKREEKRQKKILAKSEKIAANISHKRRKRRRKIGRDAIVVER